LAIIGIFAIFTTKEIGLKIRPNGGICLYYGKEGYSSQIRHSSDVLWFVEVAPRI